MKIGNRLIIHLGACKLAPRQTRRRFSLQRPRPPRAPSIMSSRRPNVGLSSSSFLCNPRSKVPRKREWILRSNKHTLSDGRNWTHFPLSYSCRLAHSVRWKTDPAMIARAFFCCRTYREIGPDTSLDIWHLLSALAFMPPWVITNDWHTKGTACQRREISSGLEWRMQLIFVLIKRKKKEKQSTFKNTFSVCHSQTSSEGAFFYFYFISFHYIWNVKNRER